MVLVSGGLDSTTCLAMAREPGLCCYTLSFDYGQRHRAELLRPSGFRSDLGDSRAQGGELNLDSIGGSALTDTGIRRAGGGD